MNKIRVALSLYLLSAAMLSSTLASAAPSIATLRQVQGTVLIEHAAGFRRAASGAALQIGERLMVLEGASAVVVGRGGCVVRLVENAHLVVGKGDDCSAVVHPAAATLLAEAIGYEPTSPTSDVGNDGFGAIGAEPHSKLTPTEIKRAEESPDLPGTKGSKSAVSGGSKAPGATPAGAETATTVVAARKPIRANSPGRDSSNSSSGESFFTGGGGVAAVAGAVAGGVGLIAALAGGGGGGAGGADPPITPGQPSQNNGGGSGNSGGGGVGGGQPPVLSPQ